ncbi:MAG: phosphoribosylamine--glycine ligase [SAR202 cluster bacterium Io17-Chloro-G9]|nr:MAG: phosphoribosylamine--glycine ligase [SAR202 cluster bacterium Io17-Chloro-G9]
MKVLIVGSGAREHALAWRLGQSPSSTGIWVANGNGGTGRIATNLDITPQDVDGVVEAARDLGIGLVVVGPEVPLALGLVDRLDAMGIPAFGPTQAAAQIESSKAFALDVMRTAGVPCPEFRVFYDQTAAQDFLDRHREPVVVKADGLAAGKGVFLCRSPEEATAAVKACMDQRLFGDAGNTVLIQEFLSGPEVSVFAFCDGEHLSSMVAACDYKRSMDGDQGPNTGGMGSFTPPEFWSAELDQHIRTSIMEPVIREMSRRGIPYRGILYAGIMFTQAGPKVLEFNCRLGDPEAQVVLPLLDGDPLEAMLACHERRLSTVPVKWMADHYVGVVMTSGGYPGEFETGFEITGLDDQNHEDANTLVFHAGTNLHIDGNSGGTQDRIVTSGGRVLTVVGRGASLAEARDRAYHRVRSIDFRGAYYRTDIAAAESRAGAWATEPSSPNG